MCKKWKVYLFTAAVGLCGWIHSAQAEPMQVWTVDPLVKVFRGDTKPETEAEAIAEVARGE